MTREFVTSVRRIIGSPYDAPSENVILHDDADIREISTDALRGRTAQMRVPSIDDETGTTMDVTTTGPSTGWK